MREPSKSLRKTQENERKYNPKKNQVESQNISEQRHGENFLQRNVPSSRGGMIAQRKTTSTVSKFRHEGSRQMSKEEWINRKHSKKRKQGWLKMEQERQRSKWTIEIKQVSTDED